MIITSFLTGVLVRRLSILGLAVLFSFGALLAPSDHTSVASAATQTVKRLAGADRYATAAAISAAHFAPGAPVAYIATGLNYPDALAGGPAAAKAGGPILLTAATWIPGPTTTELARLKPAKIYILGGPSVVSDSILASLRKYATSGVIQRLAGADRYATAAAISAAHFAPGVKVAYVVTGANYTDALVAAPAAVRGGGPLLLTAKNYIPTPLATELRRLKPTKIVIVGGTGAVSAAVMTSLQSYASGGVTRLAGADMYATTAAVSAANFPANTKRVYIATTSSFPDGLAGGAVAGRTGSPLLLTPSHSALPTAIVNELKRLNPTELYILGGESVVSPGVVSELRLRLGDIPALPGCGYGNVLTKFRNYADHTRTLLDLYYMVPSTYKATDLAPVTNAGARYGTYGVPYARNAIMSELKALVAAVKAAGYGQLKINTAFRDYNLQATWWGNYVRNGGSKTYPTTLPPGHSEHQLGTTLDIDVYAASGLNAWMTNNAWKYGFIKSYPPGKNAKHCIGSEDWHYRYVGRDAAKYIQNTGLTIREYQWRLQH